MRSGAAIPKTSPGEKLRDGLLEMSRKGLGMTVIVSPEDRVSVFTDGDLDAPSTSSWMCTRR